MIATIKYLLHLWRSWREINEQGKWWKEVMGR